MQTEAGQGLDAIVHRKEIERRANGGLFLWGVGNPPAKALRGVRTAGKPVDAIFSIMKSKPKAVDVKPARVVLWRTYFDEVGFERPLPDGSLVTSRADSITRDKFAHYALMCWADEPLKLGDYGSFDHQAYRNVSAEQGPIGASQVTALVERYRPEQAPGTYRINLRARLSGAYWVKLGSPLILAPSALDKIQSAHGSPLTTQDWVSLISSIRDCSLAGQTEPRGQLHLL